MGRSYRYDEDEFQESKLEKNKKRERKIKKDKKYEYLNNSTNFSNEDETDRFYEKLQ